MEYSDLLDIVRVKDIRLDGRLGVIWTYHPLYLNMQEGFKFGPFEILFFDHKDIIRREALRGFADIEENYRDCRLAEHWSWNKWF